MNAQEAYQTLTEAAALRDKKIEVQEVASKIRGINGHLNSLVQKKLRLDLEIRKLRKKLKKLSSQSKTLNTTTRSLSESSSSQSQEEAELDPVVGALLEELQLATQDADQLLEEVDSLPLFKFS